MKRSGAPVWKMSRGFCRNVLMEKLGLVAGVTTRAWGDMALSGPLRKALKHLGAAPARWAAGEQVHRARVRRATRPTAPQRAPATDGFATQVPGLALSVRTADCVPVFVIDPAHRAAALLHAGWRGARARILTRALEQMGRWYGTRRRDVHVSLGPHIQDCCYAVGRNVAVFFPGASRKRGENLFLSLARALKAEARAAGVSPVKFSSAPWCTACDKRFFSFRRNKTAKRQSAILMIKA